MKALLWTGQMMSEAIMLWSPALYGLLIWFLFTLRDPRLRALLAVPQIHGRV